MGLRKLFDEVSSATYYGIADHVLDNFLEGELLQNGAKLGAKLSYTKHWGFLKENQPRDVTGLGWFCPLF
jgi:hypothetical protein